jgi:hypothetical protein
MTVLHRHSGIGVSLVPLVSYRYVFNLGMFVTVIIYVHSRFAFLSILYCILAVPISCVEIKDICVTLEMLRSLVRIRFPSQSPKQG